MTVGQTVDGRYRIVAKLGEGGMGEVYAAEHIHIEKRVAIKLLRREIVSNSEAVTRFRQEARSASSIGHENIIAIEDFGQLPDGRIYFCMELLDGKPLNDLISDGPIDPDRALNILIQTCHGLAAAHAKGIIHRDMKPDNVFVTRHASGREIPKLLDFGIAKVSGNDGDNNLTKTGTIFGTPFYMAPEQALGQGVDHRADVYALGVIMYEMFGGSVPFQGESFMGILTQHITTEAEPVAVRASRLGRTVPPGIEAIIVKAMKKAPEERFQSMDELVNALIAAHRSLVGPGMSSYMEAHRAPPTGMMPASGFPHVSANMMAQHLPMPSAGMAQVGLPGVAPMIQGNSGAMPIPQPNSGPYQVYNPSASPSASFEAPAKKSKVGLIAAIVCILIVIGGGGAFVMLSKKKSGGDSQVATSGEGAGATGEQSGNGTAAGTPDEPDKGKDPEVKPDGTAKPDGEQGTKKPETPENPEVKSGTEVTGVGEQDPAKAVPVVVGSRPEEAEVSRDGEVLGKTPLIIQVTPGKDVALTISKRGYEVASVTIDGKSNREVIELKRKRRGDGKDPKDGDDPKDNPKNPKDPNDKDGAGSLGLGLE